MLNCFHYNVPLLQPRFVTSPAHFIHRVSFQKHSVPSRVAVFIFSSCDLACVSRLACLPSSNGYNNIRFASCASRLSPASPGALGTLTNIRFASILPQPRGPIFPLRAFRAALGASTGIRFSSPFLQPRERIWSLAYHRRSTPYLRAEALRYVSHLSTRATAPCSLLVSPSRDPCLKYKSCPQTGLEFFNWQQFHPVCPDTRVGAFPAPA